MLATKESCLLRTIETYVCVCVCVLLVASYQDHFETQYLLPVVPTGIKKLVQIRLNLVLGSY